METKSLVKKSPARPNMARRHRAPKVIGAAGLLVLSLTGCNGSPRTSSSGPASSTAASSAGEKTTTIEMTPNLSNFLKPGTPDTCANGGPRPCGLLIRTEPRLSSDVINAPNKQSSVSWPLEAFGGSAGDRTKIPCFTKNNTDKDGQVSSYEGGETSRTWLQVLVPEKEVKNPNVLAEIKTHSQNIHIVQLGGELAVAGYASVLWYGLPEAPSAVPAC